MEIKRESTSNIQSMLTEHSRRFRLYLLDKLIELNRPIYPKEIALIENLDLLESLKELKEKGLIVLKEDGAIIGLYPVSALKTRHKVQLEDGRTFYSMCAIDALGCVYEFNQDISISSSCNRCDTFISIESKDKMFASVSPPTTYAMHVDIEKYKNWAANCGNSMNFFCTKEHLSEWIKENAPDKDDFHALNINNAAAVAKSIFGKGAFFR